MSMRRMIYPLGICVAVLSVGACDRFVIAEAEGHVKREIVERFSKQTGVGKQFLELYGKYKFEDVIVDNSGSEKKICGYVTVWLPPDSYLMNHVRFAFVSSKEAVILNPMQHYDCRKGR